MKFRLALSDPTRRAALALVLAVALLGAACSFSSPDDPSSGDLTDTTASQATQQQAVETSSASDQPSTSDPSALPTGAITPDALRVFRPNEPVLRLVPVTPVVNSCDVLSGAALTDLIAPVHSQYSLGSSPVFADGEVMGAACVYSSDTHRLSLIVGTETEVGSDAGTLVLPAGGGEVTSTPWAPSAAVTVLSENSFGLDTPFAGHSTASGFGILAYNSGGTGIDFGSTGEVFARMADVAAANVAAAGPAIPIDPNANIQTARPCDLFEAAQLQAFTGTTIATEEARNGTECVWGEYGLPASAEVRLEIHHATDQSSALQNLTPSSDAPGLNESPSGRLYLVTDAAIVGIDVEVFDASGGNDNSFNTAAAEAELLANISGRLVS